MIYGEGEHSYEYKSISSHGSNNSFSHSIVPRGGVGSGRWWGERDESDNLTHSHGVSVCLLALIYWVKCLRKLSSTILINSHVLTYLL